MWPGVSEAWMITSIEFPNISVTVTRAAIRYFDKVAIEHQLKRLQITVDVENELAMRWAKVLKFTPEGVMRKYGAGGIDHMMFARIYE
jgi:RimJ/RimL family protein N-acetyltransferase